MLNCGQPLLPLRWFKGQQINHEDMEDKLLPASHSTSSLFLCLPSPRSSVQAPGGSCSEETVP